MWPLGYRSVTNPWLRMATGTFAFTRGAFRVTTVFDAGLVHEPEDVQRVVVLHEESHVRYHHGLWLLVFFFARPFLVPWFETLADRYAVRGMIARHGKREGKKRAQDAFRRIYPIAPSKRALWLHGPNWRERAIRAGAC